MKHSSYMITITTMATKQLSDHIWKSYVVRNCSSI